MARRICLVGFADIAYRLFLRGFVRRQVGIEVPLAQFPTARRV